MIHFSRKTQRIYRGLAGPSKRELKKRLRPVHRQLVAKVKIVENADFYPKVLPALSEIASKYAIMSAGSLPKGTTDKVAALLLEREQAAIMSKPFEEIGNVQAEDIIKAREKEAEIERQLHSLIKNAGQTERIVANYDLLLRKIIVEGAQIFRELTKEHE